jgi:hypothetical protein
MTHRWLPAAVGILLSGAPGWAHHSIAGIYDSRNQVRLEATVVDFQFINPHPFVVVESIERGRPQQWRLEMDNRFELAAAGMNAETLRKGDRISVSGGRARDESRALYVRRLDRASDGFWYEQIGSSPKVGLPR